MIFFWPLIILRCWLDMAAPRRSRAEILFPRMHEEALRKATRGDAV